MAERPRPHVLVVDRDPTARRTLVLVLDDYYEVSTAGDAIRAVSEARRVEPDVVVLGYTLPAGRAPLVVERLRSLPSLESLPVILVSGWDEQWSWDELLAMDAVFLPKPVEADDLVAEIELTLH